MKKGSLSSRNLYFSRVADVEELREFLQAVDTDQVTLNMKTHVALALSHSPS